MSILSGIFVLILIYVSILLRLLLGLKRSSCVQKTQFLSVSVIVTAKNEERSIRHTIEALLAQDYPQSLVEVIFIDDHSTDGTDEILNAYATEYSSLRIIHLGSKYTPSTNEIGDDVSLPKPLSQGSKKKALTAGITQATGEIIVLTDADCIPPHTWLTEMVSCFDDEVCLVAGFSPLIDKSHSLLGKLIECDSLVAAIVAAAGIGLEKPITCTGRNLAYRKEVFEAVNGFSDIEHSLSGDDDLFLHLVHQRTSGKIRYHVSQQATVPSYQTKSWRQFLLQKRRHLSAGKFYPRSLQGGYLVVHVTNFVIYLFLFTALIFNASLIMAMVVFTIKIIIDFVLVHSGARKFCREELLKYFPLWEIFFLVYHTLAGPLAFIGKVRWGK